MKILPQWHAVFPKALNAHWKNQAFPKMLLHLSILFLICMMASRCSQELLVDTDGEVFRACSQISVTEDCFTLMDVILHRSWMIIHWKLSTLIQAFLCKQCTCNLLEYFPMFDGLQTLQLKDFCIVWISLFECL